MGSDSTGAATESGAATPPRDGGWRVAVLSRPEEIESLREQWQALRPPPNADPEFFLIVVRSRAEIVRPHVVALFRGDRLEALLVGRLEDVEYRCTFGYATVLRTTVRAITIVTGGAIRSGPDVPWAPMLRSLRAEIPAGTADCVWFRSIEASSDLPARIREAVPRIWRSDAGRTQLHWRLDLPATFDELLKRVSRDSRKHLRRYRRRLDENFPGRVLFRRTTAEGDVLELCRRLEVVARATYLRGLGAGFVHDALTEAGLVLAARRGRLQSWELEVDGKVRAFWVAELSNGVLYLEFTGHDVEFADHHPGTVLLLEALKDMIEAGVSAVDFGLGDADYKRRFDARSWHDCDVIAFAPGLRSLWLNCFRGAVVAVERFARAVATRLRLQDRVKRVLRASARQRVVAGQEPEEGREAAKGD